MDPGSRAWTRVIEHAATHGGRMRSPRRDAAACIDRSVEIHSELRRDNDERKVSASTVQGG